MTEKNELYIVNFEGSIYNGLVGKLIERDEFLSILEIPFSKVGRKVHQVCFYNEQLNNLMSFRDENISAS